MNFPITPHNPQIAENIGRLRGARDRLRAIEVELESAATVTQERADAMRASIAAVLTMLNATDADLQNVNVSFLGIEGGRK